MLNKQQFLANHARDYSKLTSAQKDARYQSYVRSEQARKRKRGNNRVRVTRPAYQVSSDPTPGYVSPRMNGNDLPVINSHGLSGCSTKYMMALTDPWDLIDPPCIPDFIVLPSFKFSARGRGVFSIGNNGVGFISIDPWAMALSDILSVRTTNASYNGSGYSPTGSGVVALTTASPVTSQLSLVRSLRVVGASAKIRYSGTELNRGGRIIAYRTPNNTDAESQSADVFLTNPEAVTVPVDRDWHAVNFRPARDVDLAYASTAFAVSSLEFSQLLLVAGAIPGSSFEYDVIGWYEMSGTDLSQLTRSESDPLGLSVVQSVLSQFQPTTNPRTNFQRSLGTIPDIVENVMSFVGTAGKVLKPLATTASVVSALL